MKHGVEGYSGPVDRQTRFVIDKAIRCADEAAVIITDLAQLERYGESIPGAEVDLTDVIDRLSRRSLAEATETSKSLSASGPYTCRVFVTGDPSAIEPADLERPDAVTGASR